MAADVTQADDCWRFVDAAAHAFGGVDILLNNADLRRRGLEEIDDAAWQSDIDLKLMAAVRLCRADPDHAGARRRCHREHHHRRRQGALRARCRPRSRALPNNSTKSLANEYARDNIRVNTICLGLIKSAQWERRAGERPVAELYAEMGKRVLGRMGEAEEYADLVAFLVSARAAFITGTAINLDGGMGATV